MNAASLSTVCTLLLTGATRIRLYGGGHRLTQQAIDQLWSALEPMLVEHGEVRLAVSGEELLAQDGRLDATSGPAAALVRRLGDKGIGLLDMRRGLQRHELEAFCGQLADAKGGAVTSQAHLKIGAASARAVADAVPEALRVRELAGWRNDPVSDEALQMMRLTQHLRDHQEVRVRDAREIVLGLLTHLSCQDNLFLNLAEVREHSLFTYLHTCNVATLGMSFGLALGAKGDDAFDIGAAALLHDLGKTFVPREILEKSGPLDPDEWAVVRKHPEQGAKLLLLQPDASHLAVVVAYEHHMHFDGGGGYPKTPFRPSVQSQLVAIADTFDALFGKRSYHARFDVLQALEVLQAERGRMYNPELVDEFSRFVTTQLDELPLPEAPA
ncbi:MAG TPA: HD domain-containing phosphohydrolase [Thermoanaerobaculia bacterium]|nr:HD domain-containing phosphohydrolase [Thermoanaerobaculia bacterium]